MPNSFRTPFYENPRVSDFSRYSESSDFNIGDLANAIQGVDALMNEFRERPPWSITPRDRLALSRISLDLMEIIKSSTARLNAFNILLENTNDEHNTRLVVATGSNHASTEQIRYVAIDIVPCSLCPHALRRDMNIELAMKCYHAWKDYDISHRKFMRELSSLHARALTLVHPEQVHSSSLEACK